MSAAVFLGALAVAARTSSSSPWSAVWCLAAGMQWALGSNAGSGRRRGDSACWWWRRRYAPSASSVVLPTLLTFASGCVQAALIAAWPPHRWRVQRDALSRAYRSLAADVRRVAADREASVDVAPMTWLRDAFTDSQASRRPKAYHGGYRLPERITATLYALRDAEDAERADVSRMLTAAAGLLEAVADHSLTARRDAKQGLVRAGYRSRHGHRIENSCCTAVLTAIA